MVRAATWEEEGRGAEGEARVVEFLVDGWSGLLVLGGEG